MKRLISLSLLLLFTIAITNSCGGGSSGGGGDGGGGGNQPTTSTDAAAAVQSTMILQETTTISNVDASLITNLASKPAILGTVGGSISQTDFANGWIAVVQGFQLLALQSTPVQTSAAGGMFIFAAGNSWTWSTTTGGLTITFTMSETITSNYNWSLTLNGTHNGQSYNNYSIASGHINRTTLNGKAAWHQTMTIIPVPGDLNYIGIEMWDFDDGSSSGYIDFDGFFLGHYYSWTEAVDGTLDTALWFGILGNANKVWGLIINPDGSGSFEAYCPTDWNKAADGTFTAYGLHGSACGYLTACGQPDDPPCGSW